MKLWDKGFSTDKKIDHFTVGNDRELDLHLAKYDVIASKAHAKMLGEIGLAIEMGADAEDIALTIHAHPTLNESIGLAAEIYEGSITDLPNPKAKKKK